MRVLVAGAGPVGLTLALALRRQGITARLVDKASAPTAESRALGIQARTLEALEPLGLAAPIQAAALRLRGATFHLGGSAHEIAFSQAVHPRLPSVLILPQSETERLLAGALAAAGGQPERGVEVQALDPASGVAELRHPDGQVEREVFDHLLGCDGARSTVRKAAGLRFEGAAYEEPWVLADGRLEGLTPDRLHLFPGRGGAHFVFPLPGGAWRMVASLPEGSPPPPSGDLSVFHLPGLHFHDPVWWSAFRISHRLASGFRAGRACILGDAAHVHSPAGGQGMNLGIQDACALAMALPRGEPALDAWAAERRRVASMVIGRTDRLTAMMIGKSAAWRLARAVALRVVPALPPVARRLERWLAGLDYPAVAAR